MKKRGSKKKRKRQNDNSKLIYLFIVVALIMEVFLYALSINEIHVEKTSSVKEVQSPPKKDESYVTGTLPVKREVLPERSELSGSALPKLSIIIDDIGYNRRYNDLIALGLPVTLAIIPFTPNSIDAAEKGDLAGLDIMLHLPMEPKSSTGSNPGEGALFTSMSSREILKHVKVALDAVPGIRGVNNHMGSQFTEYSKGMKVVLEEIKRRGLFFIDSKTSYNSAAFSLAQEMDINTAERAVFLDNVKSEEAIRGQLIKAVNVAKQKGEAIAIGHPYSETIAVLEKMAPKMEEDGIELVLASALVR